jgi:hypothetical protein
MLAEAIADGGPDHVKVETMAGPAGLLGELQGKPLEKAGIATSEVTSSSVPGLQMPKLYP